jgi:tetratricopeptide (TPR) repeat protein
MTHSPPRLRDSYEGLMNRAQVAYRGGDVQGSIELYRRLVAKLERLSDGILNRRPELRDMHRQARLELTGLLHREGRYAEAIEIEDVLLKTHPDEADTWRTDLAILRIQKGEVETGLTELQALAEKHADEPERWLVVANESRIEGRFPQSQAALDRAMEAGDQDNHEGLAASHYQRFLLARDMGQLNEAVAAWEEAALLDPEVGKTVREVYGMLTKAGRYEGALRYVDRDENALQVGYQRGLIASLTGDPAEAKKQWRKVAALDPDKFDYGHDAWVESVLRLGDPDPALEWLQGALSRYASPRLLMLSGVGWAMRDDRELAARLFQQAINLLRRGRPAKQKLDSADWHLLESVVADNEMTTALKSYFAVVATLWG